MRRVLISMLTFAAALSAVGRAQQSPAPSSATQQPAVSFRADTNFVEINAVVTDQDGNFVKDLGKDDFEVYEDGKPQAPSVFSLVDLPIDRPVTPVFASQPVEPDRSEERRVGKEYRKG